MKVGMFIGKVKKFGISWCIHHRMAADNAKGGSGQTPPPLIGLIKNHGIGTHNDKMCADSSTGYTPNTPQSIRPICPNLPII